MNFLYKILLIGLIYLIFSCSSNKSDERLTTFFRTLESKIKDKEILDKYKNAPIDSIGIYSDLFREDFQRIYFDDSIYNITIKTYFDEQVFHPDPTMKQVATLFAFQKYLKKQPIKFSEIMVECLGYKQRIFKKYEEDQDHEYLRYEELLQSIAKNIHRGDTIEAILPVINSLGCDKHLLYSCIGNPYSFDFSYDDDTLKVKAIVVKKFYDAIGLDGLGNADSVNLMFKLEIIDLSDTEVTTGIPTEKMKIGSEFNLSLDSYGHSLKFK